VKVGYPKSSGVSYSIFRFLYRWDKCICSIFRLTQCFRKGTFVVCWKITVIFGALY